MRRALRGLALRGAAGAAVALLAPASGPAALAQTPATSIGLGIPVPAVDARAAALGGSAVGLLGGSLSMGAPADLVEFRAPTLGVTAAPEGVTVRGPEGEEDTGRSRFPLLRGVVPLGSWRLAIGFGSVLDQDWSVVFRDTLESTLGRFPFEERREHDGGLSQLDVALARRLGPLSVGGSYGRLSGTLRQSFERRFDPEVESGTQLDNVGQTTAWAYTSWRLRGGVGLELGERVRVGGVFAWTSDLEAEQDSTAAIRRFSLPTSVEGGASARLGDRFLVAASGGWANWSTAGRLGDDRSADAVWGGGGVEYLGFRLGSVQLPLRAGFRTTELPFFPRGRRQLSESAFTFGTGATVAEGRAAFDLAVEVGSRGDAPRTGVEESLRRVSISFALHQ